MADHVVKFPVGRSGPFQEAADYYLDRCYPDFSEEERAALKSRLIETVDKYKVPWVDLKLPADALPKLEHSALVKQAIEGQLLPLVESVFGNMLAELLFLQCYSFSLERGLAKKGE